MPGLRYTAKIRAKRIALHYFKQPHPLRRWKLILSVAVPLLGAAWLAGQAARSDERLYAGGPLSTAHAMFERDCGVCHSGSPATGALPAGAGLPFFRKVTDQSCTQCHEGPLHHRFALACANCHREHEGRAHLADLDNRFCTQCHADLRKFDGSAPSFAARVTSFDRDHPEFAPTIVEADQRMRISFAYPDSLRDATALSFNHKKHLAPGLDGLASVEAGAEPGALVKTLRGPRLGCTYCHRPLEDGSTMRPVTFQAHCTACHAAELRFDPSLPPVPHREPAAVHAYLEALFFETFAACQHLGGPPADGPMAERRRQCQSLGLSKDDGGGEASARGRRRSEDPAPRREEGTSDAPRSRRRSEDSPRSEAAVDPAPSPPAPNDVLEWLPPILRSTEKLIFRQRCVKCHRLVDSGAGLPAVQKPAMPARWLPHGLFNHVGHRALECTACHKAELSTETADVLLPSISLCRECHRRPGGARTNCTECHVYHDKARERDLDGRLTIRQLLGGAPSSNGEKR